MHCLVCCIGGRVCADEDECSGLKYKCSVTTLSRGRTISAKEYYSIDVANRSYNYTYYKITVPENGYIKFKKSKAASKIYIYKTINRNNPRKRDNSSKTISSGKKQTTVSLKRAPNTWEYTTPTSLKWTFTRAGNPTNYCRAKAASLSEERIKPLYLITSMNTRDGINSRSPQRKRSRYI